MKTTPVAITVLISGFMMSAWAASMDPSQMTLEQQQRMNQQEMPMGQPGMNQQPMPMGQRGMDQPPMSMGQGMKR